MSRDIHMPLSIDDIEIGNNRRDIDVASVKRLAESIDKVGLRHPITVREKGDRYVLVAGRHRIEAFKKLGREHIPAVITKFTNDEARLWEIAENLHRADLSKLEKSDQIAEWVEIVSRNLQETKREGRPGAQAAASRELGITEDEVRRSVKVASLSDEAKEAAKAAGIDDNQSKLLRVASEPPERQLAAVARIVEVPAPKDWQEVEAEQKSRLMNVWNGCTPTVKQWFIETIVDRPIMDQRYG